MYESDWVGGHMWGLPEGVTVTACEGYSEGLLLASDDDRAIFSRSKLLKVSAFFQSNQFDQS